MDFFIELLKTAFIGLVEGVTEWLPVSSTGHMILVDEFVKLQVSEAFWNMFLVVVQLGAILAVCVLYFNKLNPWARNKDRAERAQTWNTWGKILVGVIPAAVVGLPLNDFMEEHLSNAWVVAVALIVYGIVFIVIENWRKHRLALAVEGQVAAHSSMAAQPVGSHFAVRPASEGPSVAQEVDALERTDPGIQTMEELSYKKAFEAGAIQTLCAYVMPRAFAHFFARGLPQQLTMSTLHSPEAYDAVESGSVDAAFVANTRHSELVSAVPVFEDPFVLVCAQDAPYHDGIAPSELDGALSLNLEASHEYQLWHHYWFGATGQAAVADNFVLVEQILTMPGFWSIAPLTAARGSATHRGLRIVRISDAPPNRTIYMLTRGPATALATMLMDDVRSAAEQFIG